MPGDSRPFVYHFCPSPGRLGGIWTNIRRQRESALAQKYRLEVYELPDYHKGGLDVRFIRELAQHLREKKPDIFRNHGLGPTAFHAAAAARLAKLPCVILSCHSFMEDLQYRKSWRKWFVMRIMEPYTLRNAHASFCVSAYGAAKPVFRRYANENLGHINNAIEVRPVEKPDPALRREFGFSETDVVALCTSRISTEKGILYLQQAMLHLEQQGKRMPKLLLVGDGPHTALVKESMKALIERGQVVMPGRRDDVYRLLAISDFFVLPTLHEHQSQSLLEAMVQAKPIVTTRVGGNPELVVHGKTGLLVPAASASGLAEGMETMVEDAQMRRCMGQAGRERVLTEFSMDVLVQHMDALYTRMLTRK